MATRRVVVIVLLFVPSVSPAVSVNSDPSRTSSPSIVETPRALHTCTAVFRVYGNVEKSTSCRSVDDDIVSQSENKTARKYRDKRGERPALV